MKIIKNIWIFEFSPNARHQFKKLDPEVKKRIKKFINKMIVSDVNPQTYWKVALIHICALLE